MPPRLEHIGLAVRDAPDVERLYHALFGFHPYKAETVAEQGVRTIFISAGSAKLELLEAVDEDSPVRRFLKQHGEGLHHLAFEVEDVDAEMERLRNLGFEPIGSNPSAGADGKRIFFLHPRQTHGVLVEYCQRVASPFAALEPIRATGLVPYRTAGLPDAHPLLLLAAPGEGPGIAADALADLLVERFRVVAPLPGGAPVTWDARALSDLLVHAEVERCVALTLGAAGSWLVDRGGQLHERLTGLAACFPEGAPESIGALPRVPLLVVGGGRRLDAALAWHRVVPGSMFLALPHPDLNETDAPTLRWLADQIFRRMR